MARKRLAQLATVKWGKINQEVRGEVLSSARNNENAVSEMRTRGCCQGSTLTTVQAKKRLRSQTLTLLIKRNGKIKLIRNMDLN